jgi:hypothetical protein
LGSGGSVELKLKEPMPQSTSNELEILQLKVDETEAFNEKRWNQGSAEGRHFLESTCHKVLL